MRAVIVMLVAIGCSSGPNVGDMCGFNRPVCDQSLSCISSVSGGYCTTTCASRGSTSECPENSVCEDTPPLGLLCLRICSAPEDCGRTDVTCTAVPNTNLKACKPS